MPARWSWRCSALSTSQTVAVAADAPSITSEQAYRELAQHGHLSDVRIDGGFDLARLQAPAGTERLTLTGVEILGKLHASGAARPWRC